MFERAVEILDGRRTGHALPILRALSARGFAPAQNALSDFVPPRRAVALLRRAALGGDGAARYNLAIEHRNRGDMRGYRHYLAQAARTDPDAREELGRFRLRFPHTVMKRFRRFGPVRD